MKLSLFPPVTAQDLAGFLLIISPPPKVEDYANNLKKEFYTQYDSFDGKHSKPHITIVNFPLLVDRIEKVFGSLGDDLQKQTPGTIRINGLGSFEGSNVIYLSIDDNPFLKSLRTFFLKKGRELRLGKNFFVFSNPHLTIAKNIRSDIFPEAKQNFLYRNFQHSFMVNHIKVLRYDFIKKRYFEYGCLPLDI